MVKSVEERLTTVEHKVEENARRIDGLHEAIRDLGDRMERRFEAVERNMSSQFRWIVGIQMTTLIAIVGAIAAATLGN